MAHYVDKDTGATAWTWYDGEWHDKPVKVMDAIGPGSWLASSVFDGARYFDGVAPDLDLHCRRVVDSAAQFGLKAIKSAEEIAALAWEGIERYAPDRSLYIRPMFFAGSGFLIPDPDGTEFALVLEVMEIPEPTGFSACLTRFRRPTPETALTEAKAGALYPNVARCLAEALDKGFDNAVVLDGNGNVAEFATANLFLVRDGVAVTPVANGTFLAGITRSRVMALLREAGVGGGAAGHLRVRTRSSPPATTARCCPAPGWRTGTCSPARSTGRRANSISTGRAASPRPCARRPESGDWPPAEAALFCLHGSPVPRFRIGKVLPWAAVAGLAGPFRDISPAARPGFYRQALPAELYFDWVARRQPSPLSPGGSPRYRQASRTRASNPRAHADAALRSRPSVCPYPACWKRSRKCEADCKRRRGSYGRYPIRTGAFLVPAQANRSRHRNFQQVHIFRAGRRVIAACGVRASRITRPGFSR